MIGMVAYLAVVVAIPAMMLGHQGQPFPPRRWLRAARARRGSQAPAEAPETAPCVSSAAVTPLRPPQRRTEPRTRPAPHWAHTDTEEAA